MPAAQEGRRVKALIVDDERLARNELRRLLAVHPEVQIAGEARDGMEAARLLRETRAELVFLDIQMPEQNGFEFLASLDEVPLVIFTTAYDEYALKAFEVSAIDYLLKPVTPERLAAALVKFRRMPEEPSPASRNRIFVKHGERCWFVTLGDIALLESEGNYTRLYFAGSRPLVQRSLNLEERLDPAVFFRASRKHIVNLEKIASIHGSLSGGLTLRLKEGMEVDMSRRQAQKFKDVMSL